MSTLSERAMLAGLSIGSWTGRSIDRAVTEEVSDSHKADKREAGRYSKQLVATRFLHQVGSVASTASRIHRVMTSPWEDNGVRILSNLGYKNYSDQMRLIRIKYEEAADTFVQYLPDYITEAKSRLGTMFDNEDYPSAGDIRTKFYLDVEIKPVPDSGDFRVQMSDATVKAIVKDIERRNNERVEKAMNDAFTRVHDVVAKMAEGLKDYQPKADGEKAKNTFRDSLVYNIHELSLLLPALNITGDKRLEELQTTLMEQLVEHSPEVLRVDAKLRATVASRADKILAKVGKYIK